MKNFTQYVTSALDDRLQNLSAELTESIVMDDSQRFDRCICLISDIVEENLGFDGSLPNVFYYQ